MFVKNTLAYVALSALALAGLAACGDDGGEGDGGLAGASGAGGSGGDGPGAGCLDPTTQDVLFERRVFSEGGSVFYKVVEDDGVLFFSTVDGLYRVDATGGEPEELYVRENAIVVQFWVRDDHLLILEGTDTLVTMPKDGGDTTEVATLPFRVSGGLDGSIDMIVEGDFAYAYVLTGFGDDAAASYYEIDLTSYETRAIATDTVRGSFIKAGDALYVAEDDPSVVVENPGTFVPDLLYRLSIETGEVEPLEVEGEPMKMGMLGASGDTLYVLAASENLTADSGVYRISTSGGALEQVHDSYVFFGLTFAIHNTATKTLLRDLDTFYEINGGTAEELFCLGGGAYTSHGAAATDDAVYVSLFHSDDEEAFIVRMPID